MKIETELLDNHQAKLTVEVDPEKMEEAKRLAARQLARRVRIPGFRPGKAPYQVVVRTVGESQLLESALDLLVEEIYPTVIKESGIKPYGPGSLENVESLDPPVLQFTVPLEATTKLGDYRSTRRPYDPKVITETEVDQVIADLRERQAVLEPVERPAQESDVVTIQLSGKRLNIEEGQDSVLFPQRSSQILVRPENEPENEDEDSAQEEWPFPGFSRNLIGMSAQDEKTLVHTFSEETASESLRGIEAEFHFVVENVKSRTLPEVNDEFAASVGEYADLTALREDIHHGLQHQADDAYHRTYDDAVLDEVIAQSEIHYPPQMLDREIEMVIENLANRLQQEQLGIDVYLKMRGIEMDALKEEVRPVAETRLRRSLALLELAKAEDIQIVPEELQQETDRTVSLLARNLSKDEAKKLNNRDVLGNLVGNIMVDMLTTKAVERLRDIASGKAQAQAEAAETEAPAETGEGEAAPRAVQETPEDAPQTEENESSQVSEGSEVAPEGSSEGSGES